MVNVDALTWSFVHIIGHHISIAALISSRNQAKRPHAYDATEFNNLSNVNIKETDNPSIVLPPFLTNDVLHRFSQDITTH